MTYIIQLTYIHLHSFTFVVLYLWFDNIYICILETLIRVFAILTLGMGFCLIYLDKGTCLTDPCKGFCLLCLKEILHWWVIIWGGSVITIWWYIEFTCDNIYLIKFIVFFSVNVDVWYGCLWLFIMLIGGMFISLLMVCSISEFLISFPSEISQVVKL